MKKVYIVDDDRDIVDSISIVLKSSGYEVKAQYDEENLIKNVESFGPDLIILDVIFPESDSAGFDMARQLKDSKSTKNIPILMLSAINEKGNYGFTFSNRDRDNSYLPVEEFIEKPIMPGDLIKKVKELIKK
ncbi:MAG: response regulator [Elusimicrobia bacterium]|nr:response regulator [Candidatus Liberimonas magnetica]